MRRSSSGEKKNKRKSKTAPSLELGSLREQLSEGSLLTVGSSGSLHNNNSNTQPKKSPKDSNEDKSPKSSDPLAPHSKKSSEVSEAKKKLQQYSEELKSDLATELIQLRDACLARVLQQQALLDEAREELARDRALVEVHQRAMQTHSGPRVTLNVGGVLHVTSRTTLTRYPQSMFAAMFSGRFNNDHVDACDTPAPDTHATPGTTVTPAYFIDRDGALFSHVLNYLRTGTLHVTVACEWESEERGGHTPHSVPAPEPLTPELRTHLQLVSAVLEEAEYYNLTDLAHICRTDLARHHQRLKPTNHNTPRSRADSAYESASENCMYTRKEVHQMLVSHQHVLITHQGPSEHKPLLNLAGVNLSYIDLSRLDLSYVDFSRANLEGANLESCILLGTVFAQCNLQRANLQQCSFGHARTELLSATFVDANLRGANFSRFLGVIYRNNMEGANLADTIGLDEKWLA